MRYLLDTNILSDLIRQPQGRIAARITEVGEAAVCTSVVVAAELRYGVRKKGSPRLDDRVTAVLNAMQVLPLDQPADTAYGTLRHSLESIGQVIGANDMLIAAHALALGCTLVTDNTSEFARVADLRCENWLRDA